MMKVPLAEIITVVLLCPVEQTRKSLSLAVEPVAASA